MEKGMKTKKFNQTSSCTKTCDLVCPEPVKRLAAQLAKISPIFVVWIGIGHSKIASKIQRIMASNIANQPLFLKNVSKLAIA